MGGIYLYSGRPLHDNGPTWTALAPAKNLKRLKPCRGCRALLRQDRVLLGLFASAWAHVVDVFRELERAVDEGTITRA